MLANNPEKFQLIAKRESVLKIDLLNDVCLPGTEFPIQKAELAFYCLGQFSEYLNIDNSLKMKTL